MSPRRRRGPTLQEALDALVGIDEDAQRSGASELSLRQTNSLVREVRAKGRRGPKGKGA